MKLTPAERLILSSLQALLHDDVHPDDSAAITQALMDDIAQRRQFTQLGVFEAAVRCMSELDWDTYTAYQMTTREAFVEYRTDSLSCIVALPEIGALEYEAGQFFVSCISEQARIYVCQKIEASHTMEVLRTTPAGIICRLRGDIDTPSHGRFVHVHSD